MSSTERVCLSAAAGRVLAQDVVADRDYPPVARSIRDGFAVRSGDMPGKVRVIGEVRAGETFSGTINAGEAVEIMTGAPVPHGADQIVMVEHATRDGDWIRTDRLPVTGEFVNPAGSESRRGQIVVQSGRRLDYARIAMLATVGIASVDVYAKPRVAILSTGDEVVEIGATPQDNQVRNSNAYALAAQVERAGGVAEILPIAKDERSATRRLIDQGLSADLLLLSGGVSAGKYDLVETVLAEIGAEFYFDRIKIQPGQPAVFGRARERFFFGLPGNPASTMVTFELFAGLAMRLLGGETEPSLPMGYARLTQPFRHKPGLTRFLPGDLCCGEITPIAWQGSSDVPALSRANAYLVADAERESWQRGEMIGVLFK